MNAFTLYQQLLEELSEKFPDTLPRKLTDTSDIGLRIGQQQVLDQIRNKIADLKEGR